MCSFSDETLTCGCDPHADRLIHGVLGTVGIEADLDRAWFDLRPVRGGVEGELPPGVRGCDVSLMTPRGNLREIADSDGRFSVAGVPAGAYLVSIGCSHGGTFMGRAMVEDAVINAELAPAQTSPMVRLPAPKRTPPANGTLEGPERKLRDYTFPNLPAGSKPSSCEATVRIDTDGRAADVQVDGCATELQARALDAVRGWRWEPASASSVERLRVPFEQP